MTMSLSHNASQATQIEQARAVAEVVASIEAARRWPRDVEAARQALLATCKVRDFADRAFWKFPRSGEQLTGPSIDFAEEAARCWGNMASGSSELQRRPGESEMLAWATDLQTNYTRRIMFVNPHIGYVDTPKLQDDGQWKQGRTLRSVRDIRENNQSAGSRVERETILAVLPSWFVETGIARCYKTLADEDGGRSLEERARDAIDWFDETFDIPVDLLVAKVGLPVAKWLPADLAKLRVTGNAIRRGETTFESEFGSLRVDRSTTAAASVSTADLSGAQAAPVAEEPTAPVDTPPADGHAEPRASRAQVDAIFARLGELGYAGRTNADKANRFRLFSLITGERITATGELSAAAADHVAAALAAASADDLAEMLAEDTTDAPAEEQ